MNKKSIILLIIIALGVFGYSYFQNRAPKEMVQNTDEEEVVNKGYTDLSPEEANELIENNPELIIIDVSPRYAEGHLPGAVNHYIGDGSLQKAIPTLDKNVMYLVYCHTDEASMQGAQMLIDEGFVNVYRLEGNYSAWTKAGYEIEK